MFSTWLRRSTMETELTAAVGTLLDESEARIGRGTPSRTSWAPGRGDDEVRDPPISRKSKVGREGADRHDPPRPRHGDKQKIIDAIYADAARHARAIAARWRGCAPTPCSTRRSR
jgi:hypothetical protein